MTTTNVVAAQSIGTSTNLGNSVFPTKVTLDAGTSAAVLTLRVTNGTSGPLDSRCDITMWYSFSPVDVSAAAGVELLKQNARYVNLKGADGASADRAKDSLIEPVTGQFLYIWFDVPTFQAAAVMNAYVTEI
jgi:hypothetical protein